MTILGQQERRRRRLADAGLRAAGLATLALAALSFHALVRLHAQEPRGAPLHYLLAMLGCVGASGGSALLVLGQHLLDEVALSGRWARVSDQDLD